LSNGCFLCGSNDACTSGNCSDPLGGNPYFAHNGECWERFSSGSIQFTTFCSDKRIKTEIETIENAIDLVKKLEPVEFNWNEVYQTLRGESLPKDKIHAIGFIAQDVQKYAPELVRVNFDTGYYEIAYETLNSVLVEAIKEQQVFIENINTQIVELENILK
jgi:hypothetical protein